MKTIWEYNLHLGFAKLQMPVKSRIIAVREQDGFVCLWALVDTEAPLEERTFRRFRAGDEIPEELWTRYLGTALLDGGSYEQHVFETT